MEPEAKLVSSASGRPGRSGAAGDVIAAVHAMIRDRVYKPGDRLPSERALSERFGVSRPTTREAIQALSMMNVVEIRRGSGVYVSQLEITDLLEPLRLGLELNQPTLVSLFEVRLALEPLAAGLAAARAQPEDMEAIKTCLTDGSKQGISRRSFLQLDTDLHAAIVQAAHNELLVSLIASLNFLSRKSRQRTVREEGAVETTLRDHRAIVAAIEAGDAARADRAMRRHLNNMRKLAQRSAASTK